MPHSVYVSALMTVGRRTKSTTSVRSLNLQSSKVKKDEEDLFEPVLMTQLSWAKRTENLQCFFSCVKGRRKYLYSTSRNKQLFQNLFTPSQKICLKIFLFLNLLPLKSVAKYLFLGRQNTRVGTLIVATIYLQLIQNRYMFRSFTVLQCSHQHCV